MWLFKHAEQTISCVYVTQNQLVVTVNYYIREVEILLNAVFLTRNILPPFSGLGLVFSPTVVGNCDGEQQSMLTWASFPALPLTNPGAFSKSLSSQSFSPLARGPTGSRFPRCWHSDSGLLRMHEQFLPNHAELSNSETYILALNEVRTHLLPDVLLLHSNKNVSRVPCSAFH